MAWTNALDVEGAELVARDPTDPDVWFDPVALYPDNVAIVAGQVQLTGVATEVNGTGNPFILEFGVRFADGTVMANTRVSVDADFQITYPGTDSAQLKGTIVRAATDEATANMSLDKTGAAIVIGDITTPTEVGAIAAGSGQPILSARVALTAI